MSPPKMINLSSKTFPVQNPFKSTNNSQKNGDNTQKVLTIKNALDENIPNSATNASNIPENKIINNQSVENELNMKEIKSNITMAENTEENVEENWEINLKKKLNELKNISNAEMKRNPKEYYLISREWMKKFNNYIKDEENVTFADLQNKKDNDDFLIEKEKIARALSYNQDKNKMLIVKPLNAFCFLYKPCPINKPYWDMIHTTFGLEPEIKDFPEIIKTDEGDVVKRDYCKYIKVNCVILPMKRNYTVDLNLDRYDSMNINSVWPLPINYLEGLKKDIQTFYFFSRKDVIIKDLMETIENIVRKYPDIKLIQKDDYKFWVDLNYFDLEYLLNLIKEKIKDIYNIYNINTSAPLELVKLEDEDSHDNINESNKFIFKLFPLTMFEKEELKEIFPNQFTENFDRINSKTMFSINEKLKNLVDNPPENIDKLPVFTKFPEITIIIEQGINSLFYKDESNLNYKIGRCDFISCTNKKILTYFCECQKKYYCSSNCKENDRRFHEDECDYSLCNYFISMSQQICRPFTKEHLGTKGIRNIGNTCYMSTALQCLSNCVELRNYFLFGSPRKDINKNNVLGYKGLVAYGFEYLIKKLWQDNEQVIDLGKFKRAMGLCNDRFGGRSQQDTHEFVTFLIDSLHEDLNRVYNKIYIAKEERDLSDNFKSKIEWNNFLRRNQSILVDLFYGLFKSSVICSVCNRSCVDFNTFSSISVNLKHENKKQNVPDENNKENKMNSDNEQKKEEKENKMEIETNNESLNDKKYEINSQENINNDNNDNNENKIGLGMNPSPNKKEELLVGGKPTESDTSSDNKKTENEFSMKIPLIFFFYSLDEKPIQFMLPIKDKNELSHKYLLYKISQILNKDPYSLCLYHISSEKKNVTKIYGKNNFSVYDTANLENKILFVSEISHDIIKNNLTNETNGIFYDSKIHNYLREKKNTSREILENNLNRNKENIKKCINNIITEKDIEKENFEDKYLSNYYMDMNKVLQFTLKNFYGEPKKYNNQPKIVFFSKKISTIDLYFEIFKINKKIILEEQTDKIQDIKEKFNSCFEKVLNKGNIVTDSPFFLCLQANESEKILMLNEKEKNKSLEDIIKEMTIKNPDDIQYEIHIHWNKKYNSNLTKILKPEKIDNLIEQYLENKDKKQLLNESIDSTTKSSRGSNNEDTILRLQRERYNNLYDKYSSLNCPPPNGNNQFIKNADNTIENQKIEKNEKNEKLIPDPNPQSLKSPALSPTPTTQNSAAPQIQNVIKEISLEETFESFGEEELLDENNEWYCENCKKKQRAKKKLEIYHTPKILIIQIKRFSHVNKINTKVDFPLKDLDLSKYILSKDKTKSIKYDLFAVANHYGSLTYGHYTAFCKNSIDEKWYEFNDSCVYEITDLSKIVSSNAYVLFYKQQGLSKLNWDEIYKKRFVDIDINIPETLVDYNNDFLNHMCNNNENDKDDINEFDKKIKMIMAKIDENRNCENSNNKMEMEN